MTLEPSAAALLAGREREREGGGGREGGRDREKTKTATCVAPVHPLQQLSSHCPSLSG